MGVLARTLSIEVSPEMPTVFMRVLRETTPPWIQTLAGCAVLSAIIANATSMMNSIGSNLFNDFLISSTIMRKTRLMPMAIIATSVAAFSVVFLCRDILQLLVYGCEASVCCFFVLVIWALFFKKGRALSAYLSMIGGAVVLSLGHLLDPGNHIWAASALLCALFLFLCSEGIALALTGNKCA